MRLYVSSIVVFAGAVALGSISGPAMTAEFLLPSARAQRRAPSAQRPAQRPEPDAQRPAPSTQRPAPSAQRPAPSAKYEYTQVHMGVPVRIVLYAGDRGFAESAARAAFARIAQLDRMMSDYRPDSELRQIEERQRGVFDRSK